MTLQQPAGWQEVCSDRLLAAAEKLQSVGQCGLKSVQPGHLLQPGTVHAYIVFTHKQQEFLKLLQ